MCCFWCPLVSCSIIWTLNWKCPVKVGWMWSGSVQLIESCWPSLPLMEDNKIERELHMLISVYQTSNKQAFKMRFCSKTVFVIKLTGQIFIFEPTHEIMALIALRKLNLQTRMRSNPRGLHVWSLVRPFVYFHTLCVRTAKALARLRGCAVSPEPSLFAYAINTIISWAGSFIDFCFLIYNKLSI